MRFRVALHFASLLIFPVALSAQEVRVQGDRLFVPIVVNGVSAEALLDSGAEMALIDAGFARTLSLVAAGTEIARGTGGTEKVSLVEDVDIQAMGILLNDRTVAVLDLADISERLVGEPVHVVLGRELFDAARFFLDIKGARFLRVDSEEEPEGIRLSLVDRKGIKQLPISIEALEEVYADFDLGNGGNVLVGAAYATANGLMTRERIVGAERGGGIGGSVDRDVIILDSLEIGGVTFEAVRAAIDPLEDAPAANVGVSVLRNFSMTIDFSENALWLVPEDE